MLRNRVIYPLLLGVFSAFFLHYHLTHDFKSLLIHLVIIFAGLVLVNEVLMRVTRLAGKSMLATAITAGLYVIYIRLNDELFGFRLVLEESKIGSDLLLLPAILILIYFGFSRIIKSSSNMKKLPGILVAVVGLLLVVQLGFTGYQIAACGEETDCFRIAGDANHDGRVNVSDQVYLINYIFRQGPPPPCPEEANCNDDALINIGDAIWLEQYIFKSGPPPVRGAVIRERK